MELKTGSAEIWDHEEFFTLRVILHIFAACQFWYSVYYFWVYVNFPGNRMGTGYGGKFRFMTFLNIIVQAIYYTVSMLNDIFGSSEVLPENMPLIRQLLDYLMAAYAFPMAFYSGITFWVLFHINRERILPAAFDTILPRWMNHIIHTNVMVFIVLEMFTSFRQYPTRSIGLTSLALFSISYTAFLHVIKQKSGFWVYGFLKDLNRTKRYVFFLVTILFTLSLYFAGELLNEKIWNIELNQLDPFSKIRSN